MIENLDLGFSVFYIEDGDRHPYHLNSTWTNFYQLSYLKPAYFRPSSLFFTPEAGKNGFEDILAVLNLKISEVSKSEYHFGLTCRIPKGKNRILALP